MIVVTGGTGLLGSHLLCELTKNNLKVIAGFRSESSISAVKRIFDYYFQSESNTFFDRIQWVQWDILDVLACSEFINEGDEVYHCAALVSFHRADFVDLMKMNREGTGNIVNACLENKSRKLCYVSSTAAIGGGKSGLVDESNTWKKTTTTTAYSISKFSAEKEVWRGIAEGLEAVMINPCVILGPGKWETGSLSIFKHLEKGAMFFPPGANATVDARDVAKIMIKLMASDIKNDRFLCIGSNQTFEHLFKKICSGMKVSAPKIKISSSLLRTVGALGTFITYITAKKLPMNNDTVRSAIGETSYNGSKLLQVVDHQFYTLEDSIKNAIQGRIR